MSNESNTVIVLVLDTLRKDHLSLYGHDKQTSPNVDAIAEESLTYTNAVSQSGWTLPAHASMFTGKYPCEHDATEAHPYLDAEHVTIAEKLSSADIRTGCFSSNPWLSSYTQLTRGFDETDNYVRHAMDMFPNHPLVEKPVGIAWRKLQKHQQIYQPLISQFFNIWNFLKDTDGKGDNNDGQSKTPQVLDSGKDFLKQANGDRFLFMNLMDAHLPYQPPEDIKKEFDIGGTNIEDICKYGYEYNSGVKHITDSEWEDILSLYNASIKYMDNQIGNFVDWLKEEGIWSEVTLIITSDHGQLHGEHDLYGHEFGLFEPLINVPLIIKSPNVSAGQYDGAVELREIYNTILSYYNNSTEIVTDRQVPQRDLFDIRDSDALDVGISERGRPVRSLEQVKKAAEDENKELPNESELDTRERAGRATSAKITYKNDSNATYYAIDSQTCTDIKVGKEDLLEDEIENISSQISDYIRRTGGWGSEDSTSGLNDMNEDMEDRLRDLGYLE